ncbi:MAG: type IV secretion system protein [bacterium]
MKKLSLILILFISLALTLPISKAFALGNGTGNLGATPAQLAAITAAAGAPTAPAPTVNNVSTSNLALNQFGKIETDLLKTGPQIASKLNNVAGTLFDYLAVIALVVWSVQNLLFGDKGIKEFMLFILFLAFARGMLEAYNLFFNDGVVYFFYALGQKVAGVSNPMSLVQNIFYDFYSILTQQFNQIHGSIWEFAGVLTTTVLYFGGIIVLLAAYLLICGTIIIIQSYIVIALVTGYLFVPMMIFKPLEFLWNGWLKFLIMSALSYFMIFVVLTMFELFMNNTLLTYIKSVNVAANYSPSAIINEITYTFILLIFGYLVTKIPAIAGEIVSGMPNMSVTAVIAPIITSVKNISTGGVKIGGAAKTAVIERAKGGK